MTLDQIVTQRRVLIQRQAQLEQRVAQLITRMNKALKAIGYALQPIRLDTPALPTTGLALIKGLDTRKPVVVIDEIDQALDETTISTTPPRRRRKYRMHVCPEKGCDRRFAHPLPLARHLKATHGKKRPR